MTLMIATLLLQAALVLLATSPIAFAQSGTAPLAPATPSTPPSPPPPPPPNTAYLINFVNALLPWSSGSTAQTGASTGGVANLSAGRITLGACAYRQLHWHANADELYFQVTGTIQSYVVAPNNTGTTNILNAGDAIVYPQGWQHYQYNPTCSAGTSFLAFNSPSSGTVNSILSLATVPTPYLYSAYGLNASSAVLPTPIAQWVINCKCASACGIHTPACP